MRNAIAALVLVIVLTLLFLQTRPDLFIKGLYQEAKHKSPVPENFSDYFLKQAEDLRVAILIDKTDNLTEIPPEIGQVVTLKDLRIQDNPIYSLPETIGNLTNLELLMVTGTNISFLPETIGNLTSLTILDLSYNQITALPESIKNLQQLMTLTLTGNLIPQAEIDALKEILPNTEIITVE